MLKYGHDDARAVLERSSARETAARVALGVVANALLQQAAGVQIVSHVVDIGGVSSPSTAQPLPEDLPLVDANPVRCFDDAATSAMVARIDSAKHDGDTLGGTFEAIAYSVPVGLGSYVQADRRLDAAIAQAMISIQAVKAVEFGAGKALATLSGAEAHDEIKLSQGKLWRPTNRAGGIEGGVSNGQPIVVRGTVKPIPTLVRPLASVDLATAQVAEADHQRSDVTAVPAAAVVAEAMLALVLAQALTEKFGGDSLPELTRNLDSYLGALPEIAR
jgi:chorismate synthase